MRPWALALVLLMFWAWGPEARAFSPVLMQGNLLQANRDVRRILPNYNGSLKGYWRFEGQYLDDSGANMTAVPQGSASLSTGGLVGGAATLNGSSSYFNFGSSILTSATNISVSLWFKQTSYKETIFFHHGVTTGCNPSCQQLGTDSTGHIWTGVGCAASVVSTDTYAANAWNHVVFTKDAASYVKLYLNGRLVAGPINNDGGLTLSTGNNLLGAGYNGNSLTAYFNGHFDEVAMWQGVVLTSADVNALYRAGQLCSSFKQVFAYTGASQSFTVPGNCNEIRIKAWGAGGGGGGGTYPVSAGNAVGGGGAFVTGTFPVTPGTVLTINTGGGGQVGQGASSGAGGWGGGGSYDGGASGNSVYGAGGGGGGASSIFNGATLLLSAGAGGGGAGQYGDYLTGNGGAGGANGQAGTAGFQNGSTPGAGGTASSTHTAAAAGGYAHGGGGGGGGYKNGQGSSGANANYRAGGGGGGGSYGAQIDSGNYRTPGNTNERDYQNNASLGGDRLQSGSNGLIVVSYTASNPILTDQLVAYYDFDSTPNDQAGGNNGSLQNSPTYAGSRFSKGLSLNGSSQYIIVADGGDFSNLANFTFAAWIYANSLSGFRNILGKFLGGAADGNFELRTNGPNLEIGFNYSGQQWANCISTTTLATATWYHLAATYDGANLKIYINGALDRSCAQTNAKPSNSRSLTIGQRGDNAHYWSGVLDEVRIYSRAMTAEEIGVLYNNPL